MVITMNNEKAQEYALYLGKRIAEDLSLHLAINTQQGWYERNNNTGTVTSQYIVPQNRYLRLNANTQYNRKHVETARLYQFLLKDTYVFEFECLNNYLQDWAKEKQVELSWIVREKGRKHGHNFPCDEWIQSAPRTWPSFELVVQATYHFSIDSKV